MFFLAPQVFKHRLLSPSFVLWLLFALVSALASASQNLFHRKIMMTEDPYAYAFLENLLTGLLFVPVALFSWSAPALSWPWLLVVASACLWSAIAVIAMHSYKHLKVSLRAPVSETRTLWALILGAILLAEPVTTPKIAGVVIIFAAIVYLNYVPGRPWGSFRDRGVQYTLLAAFLAALVAVVDKAAMRYFNPGMYGALVYLIPAFIIGSYVSLKKRSDVQRIWSSKRTFLLLVVLAGFVFYYFQLRALTLADVSVVYPILRMSTLFTVIGGMLFLREREKVGRTLISTVLILAGVLLVSGYY